MKYLSLIVVLLLCLTACKRKTAAPCPASAAVLDLRFRLLDATTGADLFYTNQANALQTSNVRASQPCYSGKPSPVFSFYTIPGSSRQGYTFAFDNLRNPGLSEPEACFSIDVQWSAVDSGTIRWHYHLEQSGDCEVQKIDFVSLNNIAATKVDDGAYTYWELRK